MTIAVDQRVRISAHESNRWNGQLGTVVAVSEYGRGWWVVLLDVDRESDHGSVVVAEAQLTALANESRVSS